MLQRKSIFWFQSTLPRREWQYPRTSRNTLPRFQSTLPRREWRFFQCWLFWKRWFQSTLPRREWHIPRMQLSNISNFNPHSHAGSDVLGRCLATIYNISIHTPTQGVTLPVSSLSGIKRFQSTLPRREWLPHCASRYSGFPFQSTLPRREWHASGSSDTILFYFNPHSHAGSDLSGK